MNTKLLKQKILDLAIRGKLTQQLESDGTARELLEQISSKVSSSSSTLSSPRRRGSPSSSAAKTIIPLDKSEAPFEVPANWEWVRIGDIFNLQAGKNIAAGLISSTCEYGYYPCFGGNGLRGFVSCFNREGDYPLIGRQGALCGNINRATGKFYATEHAVVVETNSMMNVSLACFFLTQLNLNQYASSTAQPGLSVAKINEVPIPLPPLAEQQRIVAKIEEAFAEIDAIEKNKDLLKTHIKQTRQKILDLAIHGKLVPQNKSDEPASVLLERITRDNPHYEKLTDIPFEIPESWEWVKLGDVVKQVTDFVASGSFASLRENVKYYKEENYAILVRTLDFRNNFEKDLTYTDKHGYEFLSNSNLFGGELLLSNIGSIGKVFIVPKLNKRMTLAPNSIMVRHYDDSQRDWLYHFFLSPVGQEVLLSISSSTTQAKFNKTQLKGVLVPLPPLAEQKRIVNKIEEIFASLDEISLHLV